MELDSTTDKSVRAQVYEKQTGDKSKVQVEENDDWKYVEITPPPKAPVNKDGLVPISSLPPFARPAFGESPHLNVI